MSATASWAYDFRCNMVLGSILAVLNEAGPWRWELRESAWYGDYLNTRPEAGLRARVHEYPQAGAGGVFTGLHEQGFSALLARAAECSATQAEIDAVFRGLLRRVGATDITEIEPYD